MTDQYTTRLLIDGVDQGLSAPATPPAGYTTATIIVGCATTSGIATDFIYDDVQLILASTWANVLVNSGFESALNPPGGSPLDVGGNWHPSNLYTARETSNVHAGANALEVSNPAGTSYAFEDFAVSSTDAYLFDFWVYPIAGNQQQGVEFGWDRGGGTVAGTASIGITPTGIIYGWSGATMRSIGPVSYNAWHHFQLYIATAVTFAGWTVGRIRVG